jgi:hypothetical protein
MPDEGLPIAYGLLEADVPVYAVAGERVGAVHHVIAAPDLDIFHGIVMRADAARMCFVAAEYVAALHERGVDLRIDTVAVATLPEPEPDHAPVHHEPSSWRRFVDQMFDVDRRKT